MHINISYNIESRFAVHRNLPVRIRALFWTDREQNDHYNIIKHIALLNVFSFFANEKGEEKTNHRARIVAAYICISINKTNYTFAVDCN